MGAGSVTTRNEPNYIDSCSEALQGRGWLTIRVDAADRRSRLMSLTPKGRRLLVRAVPVWKRTQVAVEALLPDGDPNRFRKNLRSFISSANPLKGSRQDRTTKQWSVVASLFKANG
jgi:hypothetical protein